VAFTMEMLDHFEERYCIDSSRVYAAGKSNGGGFTNLLACDAAASKRIAAFAPVSGAYYQDVPRTPALPKRCRLNVTPDGVQSPSLSFMARPIQRSHTMEVVGVESAYPPCRILSRSGQRGTDSGYGIKLQAFTTGMSWNISTAPERPWEL
jgi:poly(3-hydroxybutyrate) depolymerase